MFHGFTLTKEISFKEVIKAIGKAAFSPEKNIIGPVIISLECHAGAKQQKRCVEIMRKEWGDMLVVSPLGDMSLDDLESLPSPLDLQGKILVKVRSSCMRHIELGSRLRTVEIPGTSAGAFSRRHSGACSSCRRQQQRRLFGRRRARGARDQEWQDEA